MSSENTEKKEPLHTQAVNYLSGSWEELKKVSRPTRQETIQSTIATLSIILFVSVCLFILDVVFGRLMTAIIGA